jgi:hypothetical protein
MTGKADGRLRLHLHLHLPQREACQRLANELRKIKREMKRKTSVLDAVPALPPERSAGIR